jgi:hypothetical protein
MFQVNKILSFKPGPLDGSIDLKILELTEKLICKEKRSAAIRLFNVNYREIKPPKDSKLGYRYFNIISATNERDK